MATTSSSSGLALSGLASGMDWQTTVTELANAERAPETQWRNTQATLNSKNSAFSTIKSELGSLQSDVQALKDPTLYDSRSAQSSDPSIGTTTADGGATLGSYTFDIMQLATTAQFVGAGNVGSAISADGNLAAVTLGSAGFAIPISAGTFTINGQQITITTTDTLQSVFDQIAAATGNAGNTVTATYDPTSDKITLTSADANQPIVLGSATDTSNFLQVAQLYNISGAGPITSNAALGSVRLGASIANSDLATAVTGDSTGQGQFSINGVSISYNVNTDSIQAVLNRINNSTAGVVAAYDAQNDRFVLTNKSAGDVGIAVQDQTGNFLQATGLAAGTLIHGKNLLYTLNGGSTPLVSTSNTITAQSSGISGLSLTALDKGTITVTVSTDTSKISSAIQNFISDYNKVQSYITSQAATATDANGNVTAGVLTADRDASDIASSLRQFSFSPISVPGLPSALNQFADLGIQTNGYDNTIKLSDSDALNDTLTNNLGSVKALFSDPTNGWAVQLDNYLTDTIGDDGTLTNHQATLTKQSNDINTQIANLEKTITADSEHWTAEFQAMEQAYANMTQTLNYLTQQINSGSL